MSLYQYGASGPIGSVDPMGLASLPDSLRDGRLTLEEITTLNLTKEEALMIIRSAMGTPGHSRLKPYTHDTLTEEHRRDADKKLWPIRDKTERYKCKATLLNIYKAKMILVCRHPATLAYAKQTYRLLRIMNPIHYIAERHYAGRTGREPVLGDKTTYLEAARDILLYVAVLNGTQWALSRTQGMALAPLHGGGQRAVVFSYAKGGSVRVCAGARPTGTQLVQAFELASTTKEALVFIPSGGQTQLFTASGTPVLLPVGSALPMGGTQLAKNIVGLTNDQAATLAATLSKINGFRHCGVIGSRSALSAKSPRASSDLDVVVVLEKAPLSPAAHAKLTSQLSKALGIRVHLIDMDAATYSAIWKGHPHEVAVE